MLLKALLICTAILLSGNAAANEEAAHEQPAAPPPQTAEPAPSAPPAPSETPANPVYAVRIVIDTSGSMKQTDPKNLRAPALKLLVNLLPAGSEAGIWLFDTKPELLVPAATVDPAWKSQATGAAARVNSKGAFTNIEAALSAATSDWLAAADPGQRRRVILLTDGMVDVSKNAAESAASREALIQKLLPSLQQAGIEVHAIALSEQADKDLLEQLALATGGWNAVAKDAEQLQRAFLQLFNQSVPHDAVPINDNRFNVDAGVQEFTLLVLLQEGAPVTRLIAPDGKALTQSSAGESAHWLHESGFDLVTISKPQAGEWRLEAKQDPANQVLVVSDLKMEPLGIPAHLEANEQPKFGAVFLDKEQPISREDFLGLLQVKARLQGPAGLQEFSVARVTDQPGAFAHDLGQALAPGEYQLTLTADGKTFQRETRQSFQVMADFLQVEQQASEANEHAGTTLLFKPNPQALLNDSLSIHATLTDQTQQTRELNAEQADDAWHITVPEPAPGDHWIVNVQASGKTPDGTMVNIPVKPITLQGKEKTEPPPPVESLIPPANHDEPVPDAGWGMAAAIAVAANLLLIAAGYGIARLLKKRRDAAIALLLEKFSS